MDECRGGVQENGHLRKVVAKLQLERQRSCQYHLWRFLYADIISDSLHVCHTQDDTTDHKDTTQNELLLQGR